MKKCPFCAEVIQDEAIKCRYCGSVLDGSPSTPASPEANKAAPNPWNSGPIYTADTAQASTAKPGVSAWKQPLSVQQVARFFAVLALSIAVIVYWQMRSNSQSAATSQQADGEKVRELNAYVQKAQQIGVIRELRADAHRVQVNPALWTLLDANAKRDFGIALAAYCDLTSGHGRFVDILDAQSGRTLAEFSGGTFTVH